MHTEQELKHLLEKYGQGKCSPDEIRLLEIWFLKTGEADSGKELSDTEVASMFNAMLQTPRFTKHLPVPVKPIIPGWKQLMVAASVIGLVIFSWMFISKKLNPINGPYVTIQTGQGEVKKIQLPDSSVVWMNAHTKLAYRKNFKSDRSIRLNGEATFQVTPDKSHPFIVRTGDSLETRVLGTTFNIRSYERSEETVVAVLSGQVSIGKIRQKPHRILGKNETVLFNRHQKTWVHENTASGTGWITGQWELQGQGTKAFALLLYNQYGIQIDNKKQSLESIEINANFHSGQKAEEIISTFCLLADCHYRWIDKTTVELY